MFNIEACRICLMLKPNQKPIATKNAAGISSYTHLLCCTTEVNWESDGFPSFICNDCAKLLESAFSFRQLCIQSNVARQKYIENTLLGKTALKLDHVYETEAAMNLQADVSSDGKGECRRAEVKSQFETDNVKTEVLVTETPNNCLDGNELCVYVKNDKISNSASSCETQSSENQTKTNLIQPRIVSKSDVVNLSPYLDLKERLCKFCGRKFNKRANLVNHVRNIHVRLKTYNCDLCEESFTNPGILSRHRARHSNERNFICDHCGKAYLSSSDLNHHIQRHEKSQLYNCDCCANKSFNTANSLRVHKLAVHTNPEEWKHLCPKCGRKCVSQTVLNIHLKRHLNIKEFLCEFCDKTFVTRTELAKHTSLHSNNSMYKCEVCCKEYRSKSVLNRHLTKIHGIGSACVTERVKNFSCDSCPKKFRSNKQLEKHNRLHAGDKPFKCDICQQGFICKSYIRTHLRSKHGIR